MRLTRRGKKLKITFFFFFVFPSRKWNWNCKEKRPKCHIRRWDTPGIDGWWAGVYVCVCVCVCVGRGEGRVIQLTSLRLLFPLSFHSHFFIIPSFWLCLRRCFFLCCCCCCCCCCCWERFPIPCRTEKRPRLLAFIVSASPLRMDLRSLAQFLVRHFVRFSSLFIAWNWREKSSRVLGVIRLRFPRLYF